MAHKYEHVFSPIKYGPIRLKNRIINLPMMNGLSSPEGKVTPQMVAHMASRAKSGAGLVIIGDSQVEHVYGTTHYSPLDLSWEGNTAGLTDLADEVHRYGAKIGIELNHGGLMAYDSLTKSGRRISPVPDPADPSNAHKTKDAIVMDKKLMEETKAAYVNAAERCMRAGFDEVLIHCAHGWLLYQFLNPRNNNRTDEYGGSLENRMRFPLEIIKAVWEKVGHKMAVDIRVSVGGVLSPYTEENLKELIEFVRAASPYVTNANVSVMDIQIFETSEYMCQSYYLPHMVNTIWAQRAKAAGVGCYISCSGSVVTVAEAEEILASGKADLVGMGRAALVDNRHFTKVFRGQEDDVRPCLRCAHCTDRLFWFNSIRCAVNPTCGREYEYPEIAPAKKKKKVMIVGGGPAGMQAAQTAAERVHEVVLYEKSNRLGGMLHTAAALPDKYDMRRYTEWMIRKTEECGAKIVLNTEVTPYIIRKEAPDAVLLAIGSVPADPPIPGLHGDNVVMAGDVDTGAVKTGQNVVICGVGLTGSECAIPLAREGKNVTIIDMIPQSVYDNLGVGAQAWMSILRLHRELGVKIVLDSKIKEITPEGVKYTDKQGKEQFIPCDTVINALGQKVDYDKIESLIHVVPETYTIGDCFGDKMNIDTAIMTGFTYAMEI
jgi:2,4-dienoyl-CoA reductase-like NADH-dependent reductase (Old Yellow Enzyme family)/thioredoxin reductase